MGKFSESLIKLAPVFTLLALFLHLSTSQELPRSITPEMQQQIDDYVQNYILPTVNIQGVGLGIMMNGGELLYTTGYGMADIANGIPNTNDTQFGLGSISKGFTALVTVKTLHDHFPHLGESVLDTPLSALVPHLNITLGDRYRTEHVTVRDLLAHKVCLAPDFFSTAADAIPTIEEVVYRQRYIEEICAFRTVPVYTNQMITIAGYVAAAVAGKPFEDLAQDIFNEIGMTHSVFVKETDTFSAMPGRATPYYNYNGPQPFNPELQKRIIPLNPSGGLFSTPNDMMKYLTMMMHRGAYGGRQIIAPEVIDWILKPSNLWGGPQYKGNEGDKPFGEFGYGLGWVLAQYDGWQYIEHGGGYVPYSALASIMPGKNLVVYSGSHEGALWYWKMGFHLFIYQTIMGNPNAKEIALEFTNKLKLAQEQNQELGLFADDNPFAKQNMPDQSILENLKISWGQSEKKNMAGAVPGVYGSGSRGDAQILVRQNEQNETYYYLQWGRFYSGPLVEDLRFPGDLYEVQIDTDIHQDFYGNGNYDFVVYAGFHPDTEIPNVSVFVSNRDLTILAMHAQFVLGSGLDTLPTIPWAQDSCGGLY